MSAQDPPSKVEGAFSHWDSREKRAIGIWRYRFLGLSWMWIGDQYGISGQRAQEIVTGTPLGKRTERVARQLTVLTAVRRAMRES